MSDLLFLDAHSDVCSWFPDPSPPFIQEVIYIVELSVTTTQSHDLTSPPTFGNILDDIRRFGESLSKRLAQIARNLRFGTLSSNNRNAFLLLSNTCIII